MVGGRRAVNDYVMYLMQRKEEMGAAETEGGRLSEGGTTPSRVRKQELSACPSLQSNSDSSSRGAFSKLKD